MPFQIIRNDITKVSADAIVNTANPKPVIGSGTDSAIYAAAGETLLLAARQKIGELRPGEAAYTDAFGLNARYIIHTVGPVWVDGNHGEREILRSCYENSLALADKLGCTSVAFPLISSGVYGFPKDEALSIAYAAIGKFVMTHEMMVTMVVLNRSAVRMSESLMGKINQYIDDQTARNVHEMEYREGTITERRRRMSRRRELEYRESLTRAPDKSVSLTDLSEKSLKAALQREKSFKDRLLELKNERGLDDATVYKKANLDRKLFYTINHRANYKPRKSTALALAIALELDLQTMLDLLSRAGYTLDPTNLTDLIVSYFVEHREYNIITINDVLFEFGEDTLGHKPQED